MSNLTRALIVAFVLAALFGALSAGVSTYDFVQLLDRQVHGAHCSFIPGLAGDHSGSSGCDVALMSPYSSVFRTWIWGGIPVALPGLALFVFMLARGAALMFADGERLRWGALALVGWSVVTVVTSIVMGSIALFELETLCKSCLGIYVSSFACLAFSSAVLFSGWEMDIPDPDGPTVPTDDAELAAELRAPPVPAPVGAAVWFAVGGVFVLAPVLLYVALAPDFERYIGTCGGLEQTEDRYGVLVPLAPQPGGVETIEVFDPLCPACKALEHRLDASGHAERMDRKLVLFPLDSSCNWMLSESIHPGACLTSEAVLCAKEPRPVIDWAFEHQEEILALAEEKGDKAVKEHIGKAFPELKSCVGSTKARQKLNRSLRWSVANSLKVLTPQVFIEGVALCEEDSDIGLDYMLGAVLDRAESDTLSIQEATP